MGELRWTAEAEAWLRDIHDYIAADNPSAAKRTVEQIHSRAELLREFPELGHVHLPRETQPVRVLLYGHYRIAYRIRDDRDVEVLGVFHGAMQIERYLRS